MVNILFQRTNSINNDSEIKVLITITGVNFRELTEIKVNA